MSTTDLRRAQRAVTSGAKEPQGSDNHIPCHLAPLQEAGQSSSLPTRLPRALRALAYEAVVAEDGPHPLGQARSRRRQVRSIIIVVLG